MAASTKKCACCDAGNMADILKTSTAVPVSNKGVSKGKANKKTAHMDHNHDHGHDHNHAHDHDHDHDHGDDHGHNHDHAGSPKVMIASVVLFLAAVLVGMSFDTILGIPSKWVKDILFVVAYLIAGHETILSAFKNIFRGDFFDENFLMTIATFGAIAIGEFPEAAAVMILFQIGEYFQGKAVAKSKSSIAELMNIRPDFANLVNPDGSIQVVNPDILKVGDIIQIKAGEKVPVDATIIEGSSAMDNKALTGESIPVERTAGDEIISGGINLTGLVKARVDKAFGESTVSKILQLVENSSAKKSQQERFITRFSKVYTPVVVLLAVLLAVIPPLAFAEPFTKWFSRALIFLVISCPCALVISVPLSFFAGIGGASKQGILFKGSSYVELLSQTKTVMLDKTGTLTKGVFGVTQVQAQNGATQEEVLELAAYAEMSSNHPIAKSIVKEYEDRSGKALKQDYVQNLEEISGYGVKANMGGAQVLAGNKKLMDQFKIKTPNQDLNSTSVFLAKDNQLLGIISIADSLKPDAQKAIGSLKNDGIRTVILTGDNKGIADKIAKELKVDDYYAELLPQNKVEIVEKELNGFKNTKDKLAFVGDGINDAPVLARADLGIAMGGIGSDAAIEAADVVLMTDEPSKIHDAIQISRKTMSIARQNIVFALGIKAVVMVMGAMGMTNMWGAVFADVGVSLLAVLNSMRALKVGASK